MERGGVGESRWRVIARRSKTVPPVVLGLVLVTVLFPALLFVALLVDIGRAAVLRTPFMATRLLAFLWAYLAGESAGLLALLGLWLAGGFGRRRGWIADWTWRAQRRAARATHEQYATRLRGLRAANEQLSPAAAEAHLTERLPRSVPEPAAYV